MAFIQFVRVKDLSTGHEFDVPEEAVDPEAYEVLTDYPPNEAGIPRPAKHRTTKAAQPKKATTKAAADTTEEK
jgi:hypothetical protein